jgi:Putative auto-transporter adhesin, head GIN domain
VKRISVALLVAIVLTGLYSCHKVVGHGPVITESRDLSNFTSINFGVPGDLYFTQENNYKIEIVAQENIIREIETYMSGSELKIRVPDHVRLRTDEDIRINVSAPVANGLTLSGSGNVNVFDAWHSLNTRLLVSGSGTMSVNQLEAENLDAAVSGSGELFVMNGSTSHEEADISGSGRIDLLGVVARTARTQISGSGSVKLHVKEELNTKISGSGSVYYKGNPVVNTTISGSGKVVRL